MTLISSQTLKGESMAAKTPDIAARDIVRRNHLGQNVVVVPKGQPIPEDVDATDEERGSKKKTERFENKADSGRPTPKASRSK